MPAKRQQASSARFIALNSMCVMACSSAARPSSVKGERVGTSLGGTSRGRAGRPGRPAGAASASSMPMAAASAAHASANNARAAAAFAGGACTHRTCSARSRRVMGAIRKIIDSSSRWKAMALYQLDEHAPQLAEGAWVADSAQVIGNVVLEENASVWFGAVLRGDTETLTVGRNSNVQDGTVVH